MDGDQQKYQAQTLKIKADGKKCQAAYKIVNNPTYVINISSPKIQLGHVNSALIWATATCGLIAWFFAACANYVSSFDFIKSLVFGIPSIFLWSLTIVLAVYGHVKQQEIKK